MEKKLGDVVRTLIEKKESCFEEDDLLIPSGSIGTICDTLSECSAYVEFEEDDLHPACVIECNDDEYEIIPRPTVKRNALATLKEGDEIITLVDVNIKCADKTSVSIHKGTRGEICEVNVSRYLVIFKDLKRAVNYRFDEVELFHK